MSGGRETIKIIEPDLFEVISIIFDPASENVLFRRTVNVIHSEWAVGIEFDAIFIPTEIIWSPFEESLRSISVYPFVYSVAISCDS